MDKTPAASPEISRERNEVCGQSGLRPPAGRLRQDDKELLETTRGSSRTSVAESRERPERCTRFPQRQPETTCPDERSNSNPLEHPPSADWARRVRMDSS